MPEFEIQSMETQSLLLFFLLDQLGVYYMLANAAAYLVAVVINFFLNYFFVFEHRGEQVNGVLKKLLAFVRMRIVSFAFDSGLFFVCVSILSLPKYPSRICLSFGMIVLNYYWSKRKIFD